MPSESSQDINQPNDTYTVRVKEESNSEAGIIDNQSKLSYIRW